jgi:glyceraldehyde 3-phosphate dehydrogenase
MALKIAINGFGRIGRAAFRILLEKHPQAEVVAINDLGKPEVLLHLFKYDSVYRSYKGEAKLEEGSFLIKTGRKETRVKLFSEKDPSLLPWKDLEIDVVLECTGVFTHLEGAKKHLEAGAKKVIISAPSKSPEVPTYLLGVNEEKFDSAKDNVISMGSCTTNCLAPIAKILNETFGIKRGFFTTAHGYTNSQRLLDAYHKDFRRARAAAVNIIPTTTGAAKTVEKCVPELKGKLTGIALRVPVPTVSIIDFVALLEKEVSAEELNKLFKDFSNKKELQRILKVEEAPLVSSDYIGSPYSCVVDALSTQSFGSLVKILAWYDNEWGYATRLAEMAEYVGNKI